MPLARALAASTLCTLLLRTPSASSRQAAWWCPRTSLLSWASRLAMLAMRAVGVAALATATHSSWVAVEANAAAVRTRPRALQHPLLRLLRSSSCFPPSSRQEQRHRRRPLLHLRQGLRSSSLRPKRQQTLRQLQHFPCPTPRHWASPPLQLLVAQGARSSVAALTRPRLLTLKRVVQRLSAQVELLMQRLPPTLLGSHLQRVLRVPSPSAVVRVRSAQRSSSGSDYHVSSLLSSLSSRLASHHMTTSDACSVAWL